MGTKLLFIFSILFCITLLPYLSYGACGDEDLCGNCVSPGNTDNCIWCDDDQTCRESSSTQPCTRKILYNVDCDPPRYDCEKDFSDCATCTSFEGCGWCESSQKCSNGGPGGPNTGQCQNWQYELTECSAGPENCGDIQDCYLCTSTSICGWCAESQTCMRGHIGGPVEQVCSDTSWTFYPFQCEPFIPPEFHQSPCDEKHTCEKCSQEPGCGWCQSTQKCMPGNEKNPLVGTCPDWKFNCGDRPPGLKDCGEETTCKGCTQNPYNCSWCEDTGVCRMSKNIPGCENVYRDHKQCPATSRKGSKWWIGIIVVLIIGVVGGVGFYIYKNKLSGPKPPHGSFRLGDQIEDNDVYDDSDDDVGDDIDNDIAETDNTRTSSDDFNPRQQQDSLI